mgnify:CR=1 FL=1
MILVYEANNSVEAHMILNLLEQAGIKGRIDGEYLQGGVGELQAFGIVRVLVEEADETEARRIIKEWEAKQPEPSKYTHDHKANNLGFGFIGLVIGIVATAIFYHVPSSSTGIDYNGDGKLDEKWVYVQDTLARLENDRNFDGEIDEIIKYNRYGAPITMILDENFDGVMDSDGEFRHGQVSFMRTDTTGDGFQDQHVYYQYGVMAEIILFNSQTQLPVKHMVYKNSKLRYADVDINGDGKFDKRQNYDEYEDLKSERDIDG